MIIPKNGERREKERKTIFSANSTHLTPLKPFSACPLNSNLILFFFPIVEMHSYKYPHAQKSIIQTLSLHCEGFFQWETWKQNYLCTCVTFSWAWWCLLICVCLIFKVSLVYQNGWLQRVQLLACGVCFLLSSIFGQGGHAFLYVTVTHTRNRAFQSNCHLNEIQTDHQNNILCEFKADHRCQASTQSNKRLRKALFLGGRQGDNSSTVNFRWSRKRTFRQRQTFMGTYKKKKTVKITSSFLSLYSNKHLSKPCFH